MLLKSNDKMIYLGIEERVSQKNNSTFQLVLLADPVNYENYQFFKRDDLSLVGLNKGDNVNVTFELSKRGYNNNLHLVRIDLVK